MRRPDLLQSTGWLQLREAACPDNERAIHDGDAGADESEVYARHQVREESRLRRHQRMQGARGRLQQQRRVHQYCRQL